MRRRRSPASNPLLALHLPSEPFRSIAHAGSPTAEDECDLALEDANIGETPPTGAEYSERSRRPNPAMSEDVAGRNISLRVPFDLYPSMLTWSFQGAGSPENFRSAMRRSRMSDAAASSRDCHTVFDARWRRSAGPKHFQPKWTLVRRWKRVKTKDFRTSAGAGPWRSRRAQGSRSSGLSGSTRCAVRRSIDIAWVRTSTSARRRLCD